jgi:mono/diheme cytochrome c family protein
MAEEVLLGLFHEATSTADTLDQLRQLGVPDPMISVMSGVPYRPEMLGRRQRYEHLVPIALIGALGGLLTGIFLTVGTPLLYPLHVGGQPLVPIPPSLIIVFELTMLGTMLATFAGLLAESRFNSFNRQVYDPRIMGGHIGVLVQVDQALADQAESILKANGAHHLQRLPAGQAVKRRSWRRWAFVVAFLFIPTLIVLLLAYAVIVVPVPDQMADQDSVAYEQGPRLAAPAAAVPVEGPVLVAGQPASEPVAATANSLQRGRVLYNIDCALCHGPDGTGHGPLSAFFSPPPADLTSDPVPNLPDSEIFLVITQGRGVMPSLAENLSPVERWDVVNYVRILKK